MLTKDQTTPSPYPAEFIAEFTADPALPPVSTGCCGTLPALRWEAAEAEALTTLLKALAHPVRLQMVALLSRYGGQVCVCDIEAKFDLAQPTISHHLKVLRQAGLVDVETRGVWSYYTTRPRALAQMQTVLDALTPPA